MNRSTTKEVRLRGRAGMERIKRFRMTDPLCCICSENGVVRLFDVLDHVVALVNGGADADSNLQRLCNEHHRDKTAMDMGHALRTPTGLDGWPVG